MTEAFDQYQVTGRRVETAQECVEVGLARLAGFRDQRPALIGGDQDLACPRLAQLVAVLARDVDVEIVMRMLDDARRAGLAVRAVESVYAAAWSCRFR